MRKLCKSFLVCLISLVMVCASLPAFAAETSDTVEITFKLGEDILTINGKEVQVQTPYAVGAGVTLVPVRVITEAFGANVGWIGETQTIPIEYQGVNIILQIGNSIAEVNGTPETLLAPPEISGQSTMVPLRFISETFGADVSYDNETGKITVVKKAGDNSTTLEGKIDTLRIGDSHFGWSMENPANLTMDRDFGGWKTYFDYDEDNWIGITINKITDEYNFETDFSKEKAAAAQYTLVAAEKGTEGNDVKKYYIKSKDKTEVVEEYVYVKGNYRYEVCSVFSNELKEQQAEASRIIGTFRPFYVKEDSYDLSNVDGGVRVYTCENMGYSIEIPEDFSIVSDEDVENNVNFASVDEDESISSISMSVYSKSEVGSAEELCRNDYEIHKLYRNDEITKFVSPKLVTPKGFVGYRYSYTCLGESANFMVADYFFEAGDYTYNLSFSIDKEDYPNCEVLIDKVINSVKVQAPNSEEVGIIMRYLPDTKVMNTLSGKGWKVTAPENFETKFSDDDSATLNCVYTNMAISIVVENADPFRDNKDLLDDLREIENGLRSDSDCDVIMGTQKGTSGKYSYNSLGYKTTDDGTTAYFFICNCIRGGKEITVVILIPEISYSVATRAMYGDILQNIEIEQ